MEGDGAEDAKGGGWGSERLRRQSAARQTAGHLALRVGNRELEAFLLLLLRQLRLATVQQQTLVRLGALGRHLGALEEQKHL